MRDYIKFFRTKRVFFEMLRNQYLVAIYESENGLAIISANRPSIERDIFFYTNTGSSTNSM